MKNRKWMFGFITLLVIVSTACSVIPQSIRNLSETAMPAVQNLVPTAAFPTSPGVERIVGDFSYSNDFVLETYYVEQAVALADMTGFVLRDKEWLVPIDSQYLGYMGVDYADNKGNFTLDLPIRPRGEFNDVDNNGKKDTGVEVFAVSYWPNLTGGPYAEGDDPTYGWPSYLASVKTDSENQDEVNGGKLVVWAPDDKQQFPTGYGSDGLLFTKDDPVGPIQSGYSIVNLDLKPFAVTRDTESKLTIYEPSDLAVKDYSKLSYTDAFKKMFDIISKEYAFNDIPGKAPDWTALSQKIDPMVKAAETNGDPVAFFKALQEFTFAFKDGHVGVSGGDAENQIFSQAISSGYGMMLRVLDDGKVLATFVTENGPAAKAGIIKGTEITSINKEPIRAAIDKVVPLSGPFSTDFARTFQQARYLMRAPAGTKADFEIILPGGSKKTVTVTAAPERTSYSRSSVYYGYDANALPVEFKILDSGIGYVKINSNYDDLGLAIRLFQRAMTTFTNNEVPGIIIDMRQNSGGSPLGLAGFLTNQEILMGQLEYYSDKTGKFEPEGPREKMRPNVEQYTFNKMALLVGQACASACEIEAYGFSQVPGMMVFGETPSAGVEAEVARGQFNLPDGISLQVPTGRFKLPDGSIFLEGKGVQPTHPVPINAENVLSDTDYVLAAAEEEITKPAGAGVEPSGPPSIVPIAEAESTLLQDTTMFLESKAKEFYDDALINGERYSFNIPLTASEPLIWSFQWCAKDQTLLESNFSTIKLTYVLESTGIKPENLSNFDFTNQSGQSCRVNYLILTDWPTGEHHLTTNVAFTKSINNGYLDYPKSSFGYDYSIYIQP